MIEQALYEHLQAQELLSPFLATYYDTKAIFSQEAPDDMDEGWRESQYGRIVFVVDMTADEERGISGTLGVDFICQKDQCDPEAVEPILKELIDGYFFIGKKTTISASWKNSSYFSEPKKLCTGVTITFDLLDFPDQETEDPDPVKLLNSFLKKLYPTAFIIGVDKADGVAFKPTNESPAMYVRLARTIPCLYIHDIHECTWRTATMHIHCIAEDKNFGMAVIRHLDYELSTRTRLLFEDKAPLMLDSQFFTAHDEYKVGQLVVEATYGMLRPRTVRNPLQGFNTTGLL